MTGVAAKNSPPLQTNAAARRLTRYYIAALSAVALLSLGGQLLVQTQLRGQLSDSKVVNLAGRQRMLSQRLCKCAALLTGDPSTPDSPAKTHASYLEELRDLLPHWRRTQQGLQYGDAELGLPGNESAAAAAVFARLEQPFSEMRAAAERLANSGSGSKADQRRDLAVILENEATFLAGMDEIVSHYETESHERVARLLRLERLLLGFTLGVLLLEGFLVFRPAARHIAATLLALERTGAELREAKEAAEAADKLKSRFLANMSHELRTPLHSVLGAAELLRNSNPDLARADYLDVVDDSSRMLLCLLNDVLDLSKIEADKIDLHPTPLVLREFTRRMISMFRAQAQAKQLELVERIEADVPAIVKVDPLRLRQVLANLLANGIKFTERGTVALRISVAEPLVASSTGEPARIRFDVVDTGIGIAAADQAKIFESFTQLELPAGTLNAGAGLGLAITSRLVSLMGGRLDVRSESQRGSTFTFALPCTAAQEKPSTAVLALAGDKSALDTAALDKSGDWRPLKILAAEDSPVGRRLLEDLLLTAGHRVQCVVDGASAIAAFERESFDLVLLDLRMPGVGGVGAAAAMRAFEQQRRLARTTIIAVTADPLPTNDKAAPSTDFDDYVMKPFSGTTLQRTIERHTGRTAAATAAPSSTPGRAAAVLSRLQGRQALLNELVEIFLADAPQTLSGLQQAVAAGDLAALHTAAHRLRGQLETFEDRQASACARRLEQAARDGDQEAARRELAALLEAWPAALDELAQLRTTPTQSVA